ncbi:hypothetical protein ACFYXS_18255 [Streptomyces sp. NPDC002574]|uniref:hypothetical protein n=1 Tax=Streptomyces sp. NPDC002574 TaxID=3364652 RepID=UPI0036A15C23
MTRSEAISRIRMLAADRAYRWPGTDRGEWVRAGLDALLAGADSPSPRMLAGLGRNETHEADALFDRVLEELGLLPLLPEDVAAARRETARYWAGLITHGTLAPADGVRLIRDAAVESDSPGELVELLRWAEELDEVDHGPQAPPRAREDVLTGIVEAAARLLAG